MASLTQTRDKSTSSGAGHFLDILLESETGSWVLTLPPVLKAHQQELESLISKCFSGKKYNRENFSLAQQLALNWCFSKAKQFGMALEDCWAEA